MSLCFIIESLEMSSSQTTILLAEDESNDVFLMQRAFKKAMLSNPLRTVHDGEEAIAYLSGEGHFAARAEYPMPTLMLLDLKLPRKSGLEVLAWIRGQSSPVRRLPVIVLTSSRQNIDVNRAYDLGANSYLVKPVTFEGLVDMIRSLEKFWLVMSQRPEVQSNDRV